VNNLKSNSSIEKKLNEMQKIFSLDAVEYYPNLFDDRIMVVSKEESIPQVPSLSLEFLQKGIKNKSEASTIHQFGEGNLVRVIVPINEKIEKGAIVVSSYVPLSLMSKMNDITSAYEDFRDVNPLEYPLKSIYTIILFMMTLVILLAATWFGFYLAKQLSIPLVLVGRASRRVAEGDYSPVQIDSGSEEIHELINSFNQMMANLDLSEKKVKDAHNNLQITLDYLDKHSRYIEVILANVSAGIISVDHKGTITTINRRASELLKIENENYVGQNSKELFSRENYKIFLEILKIIQEKNLDRYQKELTIQVEGQSIPLQVSLSILRDEKGAELGRVLVFDDLSLIVNAQRAAAWSEVAQRIAHEIKNPLTPIKLSAERLQRKFGQKIEDPAFAECTSMIIKQTDALRHLVNEFYKFARLPEAKKIPAQINPIIEESLTIFRNGHPQVQFQFQGDPEIPIFKFDPDQIKRVLINLVNNSLHALAKDRLGKITLETHFNKKLKLLTISVNDNGLGIPAEDRNRIFEPYYSTKETGTGLGLPIVKRIIEDHNGFIRALANEDYGTRMIIELPIV
jgi:two-component system nitrogen regulation sensor histidine kinase NtrY